MPIFPEQNTVVYRELTPLELFELFFDDELLEEITKQSNLYARQKNIFESSLDSDEIRLFFSILIITGYAPKPSRRSHWQNNMDLRNEAIYNAMRRNRFEYIMKCLHFKNKTVAHYYTPAKKFMLHFTVISLQIFRSYLK